LNPVLVCDALFEYDHYARCFEVLCGLFPNAPIATYVYKPNKHLGPLSHHRIRSSSLQRLVADEKSLRKWIGVAPQVGKNVLKGLSEDCVISFSRGLAHQMDIPKGLKHIAIQYDERNLQLLGPGKIFQKHLRQRSIDSYENANKSVRVELAHSTSALPSKGQSHRALDYYLVFAQGLLESQLQLLVSVFEQLSTRLIIIGKQEHEYLETGEWSEVKTGLCQSDIPDLLEGARAILNFQNATYPYELFKGLALGRPYLCLENTRKEFSLEVNGGKVIEKLRPDLLKEIIVKMDQAYRNYLPNDLKEMVKNNSLQSYRNQLIKNIRNIFPKWNPVETQNLRS
jgi:hypothetical protein